MIRIILYVLSMLYSTYAFSEEKESIQKNDLSTSQNNMLIDDVTDQCGESLGNRLTKKSTMTTYDNIINKHLDTPLLKNKYFDGFMVNEVFSHAMLNPLKRTGHPLFMMQARRDDLLADDKLYVGGKTAIIDWNHVGNERNPGSFTGFKYLADGYVASTLSKWTSTFVSLSVYYDGNGAHIYPYSMYFMVGDLTESDFFGYVASDVVMFGNFDIVSNFVPTLTRLYFMQSGGNANISYSTDNVLLNAVILNSNPDSYFGTTNADSKGGVGYSLNAKYTYEMEDAGDFQYFGFAYSNSSAFNSNSGGRVGVFNSHYVASISNFDFFVEGALTDRGV